MKINLITVCNLVVVFSLNFIPQFSNSVAFSQEVLSLENINQAPLNNKSTSLKNSNNNNNDDDNANAAKTTNPEKKQNSQLIQYCQANQGEIVEPHYCPTSKRKRTGPFCKIQDDQGRNMFFNGCTGADKIPFGKTFFKACILHDFCYHHEPTSNGFTKDYCDKKLLKDMRTICDQQENNSIACKTFADLFYAAVRTAGSRSWECSKVPANYPKNLEDLDVLYYGFIPTSNINKDIIDIISVK